MIFWILLPIHVLACLFLILVVLLQSGKAGDIASAFGGAGSQAAFGPRGSGNVLTKATAAAAIAFMVTSLGLVIFGQSGGGSVLDEVEATAEPAPITQPLAPSTSTLPAPGSATATDAPVTSAPTDAAPAETAPADVAPDTE